MELVSVVIPAYNREKTIREAVESVLEQSYTNLEVIIVDDCSTDRTVENVESIPDDRVIIIRCKENGGACRARNIGIENAKGEYIAFHDSDDIWHADKLEKSMYYLKKENVDFVFSALNRKEMKSGKEEILPSYNLNMEKDKLGKLLSFNCVSTQTILVKRAVCERCKFDIDLPRFQDWDFAIQILKSGFSVYYIAEPLVECFVLNDSITSNGEKGKKALCIFDKKYKNDYIRNKESGKEFYFRAAVMMEKMGYNGKKYFRKAYAAEKGLGMYIRYLMSAIRIYRPINKIFDRIINGI